MSHRSLCLLLFATACHFGNAIAQSTSSHHSNSRLKSAVALFHQSLLDQSGIYNGSIYVRPSASINEGHVYFKTDRFSNGSLMYDGVVYNDVPLLYDESKDALVTKDISGLNLIQLVNEKISFFFIGADEFIKPAAANQSHAFYRVVHRGTFLLLHRENKFIRQRIVRENEYFRHVQIHSSYWLFKDGSLTPVDTYRRLINVFGESGKKVQEHIRRKGLKYREAKEPTIIEAINYFETLQAK